LTRAGDRCFPARQDSVKLGGSMIHAAMKVEINTKAPNPAHTRMMSNFTLSSCSDAQSSMVLRRAFILLMNLPSLKSLIPYDGAFITKDPALLRRRD
jgi:hypothetical protein